MALIIDFQDSDTPRNDDDGVVDADEETWLVNVNDLPTREEAMRKRYGQKYKPEDLIIIDSRTGEEFELFPDDA